jgi:thiol:disulfide interchange protein
MNIISTKEVSWGLWVTILLLIILISIFGRKLQYLVQSFTSLNTVGMVISALLVLAVALWLVWGARLLPRTLSYSLAGVVLLVIFLTYNINRPEEKLHLLLFGIWGFLTLRLFGLGYALLICLSVAGLDEGLQHMVPDRVADWRDVGMNAGSAVAGVILGWAVTLRHVR